MRYFKRVRCEYRHCRRENADEDCHVHKGQYFCNMTCCAHELEARQEDARREGL